MTNQLKVAVVTGSNKGIGFAIVRSLYKKFNGVIYLTSRNEDLGRKALNELEKEGVKVNYHQLDIDDINSINSFAKYLKDKYNGLDILINNAAIAYKAADTTPFDIQAEHTTRVNFIGTLNVCNALFPLLKPHARVVNVSSRVGMLKTCKSEELRKKLTSQTATVNDVVDVIKTFIQAAKDGKNDHISTSAYGMSKVGLTAVTKVHQRQFNNDSRADLVINACCPGYVDTDMSSHKGHLTIDQGAETPVYLALLPENTNIKGEFLAEQKIMDWTDLNWKWQ